jgi:hypothetical protein
MKIFNTLTEAVIAAINQIKYRGVISAHNVTTAIRINCNNNEWAIPSCTARPNAQGIQYWINHDDVRRVIRDLYVSRELDTLGFIGRVNNGTFFEYSFSNNNDTVVDVPVTPMEEARILVDVPVPATPVQIQSDTSDLDDCITIHRRVNAFISKYASSYTSFPITMKRIQSALKIPNITCAMYSFICRDLGYQVYAGNKDYCYSTYFVTGY